MFIDTVKAEFNSSWYAVNFLLSQKHIEMLFLLNVWS